MLGSDSDLVDGGQGGTMAGQEEILIQLARSEGDLVGVFEHDGQVGYFYLFDTRAPEASKIRGAIRVAPGGLVVRAEEVGLLWDMSEKLVGMMVRGCLCAVFDTESGEMYGGDFRPEFPPALPDDIRAAFSG